MIQKFSRQNQNQQRRSRKPLESKKVARDKRFTLAVIIPAMNESDTIGGVIDEINRLDPNYLVVVDNGSTDQTAAIATNKGANVVHYPYPLGNDVGRALGAIEVEADIYLFTDADIAIKAEAYLPFIKAIEMGDDVSINSIDWVTYYQKADSISAGRYFLNYIQNRSDLRAENVLTIPHALSQSIIKRISAAVLVNPVLANSIALEQTEKVSSPGAIDVLRMNKVRKNHFAKPDEIISTGLQRMQGDTYEALHYVLTRSGRYRQQALVEHDEEEIKQIKAQWDKVCTKKPVSLVIHIDETFCSSTKQLIQVLMANETVELVPVVSSESTSFIAWLEEIKQPHLLYQLKQGEGASYHLGSIIAQGVNLLFHNANQELSLHQVARFIEQASLNPNACVVNNQEHQHTTLDEMNNVFIGNQLINMANSGQKLITSGFVLPPFLVPAKLLVEKQLLQAPVKLQVELLLKNQLFVTGPSVNVTYPLSTGKQQSVEALLAGFSYLFDQTNERGSFTDEGRRRELIPFTLPEACIEETRELIVQRVEINQSL